MLAILCFVYVLNFLDRQLLSILAKPIQDELGVTDGQLGLISGLYFALFYCLLAIPVGWLADRTNRVRVLSLACALWSAATVACGFSSNYPQLAAARMSVGVGEAGGVPPSYAIISDYFPPGMRGTALSLFNLGPPIGQALGVAFGASIAAAYSWRSAFVCARRVGIVTALIVLAVRARAGARRTRCGRAPAATDRDRKRRSGRPAACSSRIRCCCACRWRAARRSSSRTRMLNFTTLFLMREKGMTLERSRDLLRAGHRHLDLRRHVCLRPADRPLRAALEDAPTPICRPSALALAIPFFIGFVWAPGWPLALAFLAVPTFLNYFYLSPSVDAGAGGGAAARARARRRAAAAGDEPDRARARSDVPRRRQRSVPAQPSGALAAAGVLHAGAVLRRSPCSASSGWRAR